MPNALGLEHAATIADPAVIEQILTHLGLSSGPGAPGPAPPAGTAVVANS